MNIEEGFEILNIMRIITTVAIVIIYLLAFYWNTLFLIKTEWQEYSYLKLYTSGTCLIMAGIYFYFLILFISGSPIEISIIPASMVRPIIILLGASIASNARARYTSLNSGGEKWMLRKLKTS